MPTFSKIVIWFPHVGLLTYTHGGSINPLSDSAPSLNDPVPENV